MGDIDLLNVNVSHFEADYIFVRTVVCCAQCKWTSHR